MSFVSTRTIGLLFVLAFVSVSLYVHRKYQAYEGLGAQGGHLDFHTAPEFCGSQSAQSNLRTLLLALSTAVGNTSIVLGKLRKANVLSFDTVARFLYRDRYSVTAKSVSDI